ncbi:MAG: FadR family transcriptional regulator [Treponema sp.]|nr:FadR family transcriptional regulator [Treponema sp.]
MKQLIINGEWAAGQRLPSEFALCEMFSVSRVTIRHAFQKLNTMGLLETFLGDGSYIKKPDTAANFNNLIPVAYLEDDIDSILEFRMELESGTCAIAAQRATAEDIAELRAIVAKAAKLQNKLDALAQTDLDFHYCIAKISRNSLFIRTYEIISDIYTRHMRRIVKSMGGSYAMYYHSRIVDAIEKRDSALARKMMYEHIMKNVEFIKEGKAELPDESH